MATGTFTYNSLHTKTLKERKNTEKNCKPFKRDTKNVSDFVQKHFMSATNVSQFAQPRKHHGQQCVLVYQGL